jgi:hypothetical protein
MTEQMVAERGAQRFSVSPRIGEQRAAGVRPRRGPAGGQVTLNKDVSWDLRIRGGVAHLEADLRGLRVEAIEANHGASRLDLQLPRPSGVVPVRIGGGASHVQVTTASQPSNQEVGTP